MSDQIKYLLEERQMPTAWYNINADMAAGAIAKAMSAKRLLLLTDIEGVKNKKGELIEKLNLKEAEAIIKNNIATGGMVPKIKTAIDAKQNQVEGVAIIDGRKKHVILLELLTKLGAGTLIV